MRKAEREALAAQIAAEDEAYGRGEDWHRANPEELLAAVYRYANTVFDHRRGEADAFVDGYKAARARRDEYLREQRSDRNELATRSDC